jgi:acetolactate synthase I/II/III large subunit
MAKKSSVNRRNFLKGAAAGAAALVAKPQAGASAPQPQTQARGTTALPSARLVAAGTTPPPPRVDIYTTDRPGSDFMVDVLKSLDFEYVAANPGSAFRALHESFLNYGGNKAPEWITCLHEESSVAMAHGTAGQGSSAGARIGGTSLNLQGVMRYVRQPAGAMPAFTDKVLTDQELTDIHAYLKSVQAPKAANVPLLNQLREK